MEAKRLLTTIWLMMLTSVFAITSMAQETTVQVNEVGTLWETLDAQGVDISTVTNLKVIGPINNSDFRFMRSFLPALVSADLVDAEFDEVPGEAFRENTRLRTLRLPANITRISDLAFYHCDALESVAFGQTDLEIGKVVFPASLTSMGGGAFEHCIKLQAADFSACTDLGIEGFYQCSKLTEIILPATGNIRFGGNCFLETDIEELTLTPAVTWLEYNALPYSLKTLIVEPKSPINSSVNAFDNVNRSSLRIWVPQGTIKKYSLADGWYNVNNLIQEYNVKVNIQGEGTLLDGMTALNTGSVFLHGDQTTLTAQPAEGYTLQSATLAGQTLAINDNTITLPNPAVEGTLTVVFAPNAYTLTIEVTGDGTVLRDGVAVGSTITMAHGESATLTLNPADGLSVQSVEFNGEESVLQNGGQTYTTPAMTGDANLHVIFGNNDIQNTVQMTVVTGEGGTVIYKGVTLEPTSVFRIKKSEAAIFTFAPVKGMRIDKVLLNDTDLTDQVSNLQLSIGNLTDDAQMEVTFISASNIVVNNPNGGELNDLILAQGGNAKQVTTLKITGTLNARDWTVIQNLMTALEEIDLSGTDITEIPEYAFDQKHLLKKVKLPTTVTRINGMAFHVDGETALETIEGCDNVEYIGGDAFSNRSSLKTLPFGDKIKEFLPHNALHGCISLPKNLVLPASLTYLGHGAFNETYLNTIDLRQCVRLGSIEWYAVGHVSSLLLPETGSFRLGGESLRGAQFTELILPASVNRIDNNVMPATLQRLYVKAATPIDCDQSAFDDVNLDECILYVPIGSSADYQLASGWFKFDNVEEYGYACSISGKGVVKMGEGTYSDKEIFFPVVGTATTFQIVPDVGYEISSVKFNNQAISLTDDNTYTIGASVIRGRLEVQFVQKQLTATLEIVGAGSVTIDGQTYTSTTSLPVAGGSVLNMVMTPNEGNFVKQILLNGEEVTFKNGGLTYTTPEITENCQIKVTFASNSEMANMATVTVGKVGFGTIRHKGLSLDDGDTFLLNKGDDLILEVLAEDDADAQLTSFLINDVDVTAQVVNNTYTMTNVTNDIAIEATFFSVTHLIVNNPNGGELNDQILAQGGNARKLTSLKINGTLNARDWTIIQNFMTNLEEIDLSETNLTSMPENAFNGKGLLKLVKLPSTVTIINGGAFANCNALTTIEGCENVKEIGGSAFANCSQLKNFPFGDKLSRIESWNTFENCQSLPRKLNLPASLTYLGGGAFNYPGIEAVDFSACANLERIEHSSVGNAKSVILPETGSYSLGGEALRWAQFTELTLPANVNRIDPSVMPATLLRLYVKASTPIDCDQSAFDDVHLDECLLYVPMGTAADYQVASGWLKFDNIEEFGFACSINGEGVVKVGEKAYSNQEMFFPVVGTATTFQIVPDVGYEISSVKFNNQTISLTDNNTYTIGASVIKGRLEVQFVQKQLTATLEIAGAGSVTIDGQTYTSTTSLPVVGGSVLEMVLTPDDGNFVKQILLNGEEVVFKNGGLAYTTPKITEDSQIKVVFAPNSELANMAKATMSMDRYGIVRYKGLSLQDGDMFMFNKGDDLTLEILPEGDAQLTSFLVNDVDVTAQVVNNAYTITNVTNDITIDVRFFSVTHLIVDNPNGGELNDLILAQGGNVRKLSSLKINGTLNARDWTIIQNLMSNLEEIDLSETNLTSIPENAFRDKGLLRMAKLPTTVTVINGGAFANCNALTTIEGCENVKEIGGGAFWDCSQLKNFPFGDKLTHLHWDNVLYGCNSLPKNVVMPATLQYLGGGALNYSDIESVDLSQCVNLEAIDNHGVGSANIVILPEKGSFRLGDEAFRSTRLTEVTLPGSVNAIGNWVMPSTLRRLYVCSSEPVGVGSDAFSDVNLDECELYVPIGSSADYQLASGWYIFNNVEEFGFACSISGKGVVKMGEGTYSDKEIFFPVVGTATTFQIVPDVGYEISSVKFNNQTISLTDDNTYTIGASVIKGRLEVQFVQKQLTATLEIVGAGSVTIDGQTYTSTTSLPVAGGSVLEMVLTPDDGNFVKQILLNGEEVTFKNGGLTYTTPEITENSQIKVVFASNSEMSNMATVTVDMVGFGSIRYKGLSLDDGDTFLLNKGDDLILEILAEDDADAQLTALLVNDVDVTAQVVNNTYTMTNVTNDIAIEASFFSVTHLIVDNPNGGELNDQILAQGSKANRVTSLKVNGTLNARDWNIIKNLMGNLEEIDFSGTNITEVPESAFQGKSTLRKVVLPTTVTVLRSAAFHSTSVESIEGYDNIREIHSNCFENAPINHLPYGNQLTALEGDWMFGNCKSLPQTIVMPRTFRRLGSRAFTGTSVHTLDLHLCSNLEGLGWCAAEGITILILPEEGAYRLEGQSLLTSSIAELSIPTCVSYLGGEVMPSTLERLYVEATTPIDCDPNAFEAVNFNACTLYVPTGSSADYQLASGWFKFDNIEEYGYVCSINGEGVIKMGEGTYSDKEIFFPVVGTATTFQVVPDVGYEISSVKFNNQTISLTDDNTYTVDASVISGRLEVQFVQMQLTSTLEIAGAGSVTIDGQTYTSTTSLPVAGGSVLDMVLTPNDGNFVKQILLNGEEVTFKNGGLAYSTPEITENSQIKVIFAPNSELANMAKVTMSMVGYGSIRYKDLSLQDGDTFLLNKGDDLILEVLLEDDSQLISFLVNDVDFTEQVVNNTYTMTNVTNDIAILASFFSVTHLIVDNPNGGELNDQILAQGGNARNVKALKVDGKLTSKDWSVIQNLMSNLEEIDLSATNITEVPEGALRDKPHLTAVKLPATVTQLSHSSFRDCPLLSVIEGCDNVEIIGPDAFVNCTSLPSFPFGNRLQVIDGWNPFDNCYALPKTVILPATFRNPGPGAFANTSIETVDLSKCINLEGVQENSMGFATRIILPESGSYGVGCLNNARLTELVLPACVNMLDPRLPSTLKRLYVKATTPFNVRQDVLNDVNLDECVVYVPTGSLTDYKLNSEWSNFLIKLLDIQEYGLRVKVGGEGKVKVGGQIIIGESGLFLKDGETATIQIIPQEGWHVGEVKLNNTVIPVENDQFTITGEQATGLLTISFAINTFDFAVQIIGDGQVMLGEDVITNGQVIQADYASVLTFTLQPAADMVVANITLNGEETVVQNGGTTYVTPAITRASALQVTFSESGEQGDFVAFNVKTGDNGTVEYKNTTLLPQTSIQVPKGQDAIFTIKPNPNYVVQSLIMNGEDITDQLTDNKLTILNVAASAQMEITFKVETEINIEMEREGLLSNLFNEETRQKVSKLTISGPLNDNDFRFMRDELPMLSELDLWDAQCNYIPDEAFCISNDWDNETGKQTLTKVRLPECTYRIGYRAFAGCTNLSEVNFEDLTELNDIAGWAFTNTGLRRADLSYTRITDLGDCQFRKARKMEHVALPNTITNIGNAFQENSVLTEIDLLNCTNLTNINDAFSGDRKLTRVVLPEGLKSLNNTFNDCQALINVNFPTSLESIGDWTFFNTRITSADLKPCTKLQRIGGSAFNSCLNLANVTFPTSLQRIMGAAFHQCTALTAVDMSQLSLTEIEGSLFCWCGNLESVKLPKTVVTIRDNAFRGTKLSGILELPASLTTIEHDAFSSTQITIIKSAAANPPALATENEDGENVFSNNVAAAFVPEGCANRYKEAPVWEDLTILDREVQAEVTVTHEGNLAIDIMEQTGVAPGLITHLKVHGRLNATDFAVMRSNMTLLYDLDMEDADVSVIPENAFLDKKILMNVKLPESLLVIQENAFKGCSALSGTLILPSGVTTIGWAAFQGCTSLNGIVFSDALEVIRSYAFEGCVNLTQELTFPDQLLSIGEYAFANCRNLFGKVKFNSEFYQFIGAEGYWSSTGRSFENCSNIDEVDLSECEYLYEIPSATFNECYALKTVKLPPYLERIDDHAFMNCRSLRNISFPTSLLVINYNAFNGCSSLRSVDLSSCKTFGTIEGYAFSGCSSLETVNLPKSLNWIQEYAFNECRKLANLNVEALQPADLGEYVFRRVNTEKCVLSIPTGVYYDYLTAAQWGAFVQMRNAIDITLDEGANLSYTNNANVNADDSPNHAPRRRPRRAAAGVEQTGEANVKDGTSLYVSEDESVTFYINPEENVSIKQVLFNGEDVTDQLIGNAFETPKVTEASSFKVLLNIDGPITVKELRMIETELAIKVAESHQIIATVYPNNATNKTILWSSSDEEVAKVMEDGTVTGMKAGRATITACTEDGGYTQTCEVVVMSNDYYVMLSDQETFVQNEVRMPLVLHNTDNASGIQFDVYTPEGISLDPYRVEMSGRNNGHIVSAANRSDGSVRVIVYSNEGNPFLDHDGELLILPLTTEEEVGEFVVDVKNIHISGPNSFDFVAPNYSARILVSDYPLGDSNGNGEVTVSDVVNTVDELLELQPARFIRKAADVNKDGIITVSDVTATVDIILETPASPSAGSHGRRKVAQYGDDKLFINDFSIEVGQQESIMLELDNITEYTAFQCDIFLPEGISIAKDDADKLLLQMTGCKTASHVFSARYVSNGALRIIVYSMEDEAFNDSEEGVFSLTLEADSTASLGYTSIQVQNIRLVRCSDRVELMVPDTQTRVNIVEPDPTGVTLFADDGLQVRAEGRELIVHSSNSTIMPLICVDGKNQMIRLQPGENRINIEQPGIYVIRGKKFIFK